MDKIIKGLEGRKTYVITGLTVLYVIIGAVIGKGVDMELLAIALTGATLRNSIK